MTTAHEVTALQPTIRPGMPGYDIEGVSWEQSHAIIHHGRRKVDGLPVLIKLPRDFMAAEAGASWLQRDNQIAKGLEAKCVAKPLALENTDCGTALIYVDEGARPLQELFATAPLDIETVLTIGSSIAEAVAALHKERLFHCNLNPTTIWLKGDASDALIFDFSCARHSSTGLVEGLAPCDHLIDIRYVSPELTGRFHSVVDQRTDIYSLGIILFQLLTGKVPFDGTDSLHIIDGHLARQPASLAELRKTIPAGLAKVVLKAVAKSPEDRYLTVNGILADLVDCRSQWRSAGSLEDFEAGRHDAEGMLRISRQLYGRERDKSAILAKARAVHGGRSAMLLVNGPPGVGKSALLSELKDFVQSQNWHFVAGKFDQYNRHAPYLSLVQAFQQLIGQLLSENKDQVKKWQSRILAALGKSAQVVIELIPELELIIGAQPAVPALPPIQARNRFNRLFANLLRAFAPGDNLLCVVMDDLQWADRASLDLLTHILTDPDSRNILFVGAYRDNEVGPDHPLKKTTGELSQLKVDVQSLHLDELKERDVSRLVRDSFNASSPEVSDLARVLHAKTGGNPLHVRQLLHFLCDEGLIGFEYATGKWGWDLARIDKEGVAQDLLDLLNARLKALHPNTRFMFATAACLGSTFDLQKLAAAASMPSPEVLQSVKSGIEQGLLTAVEGDLAASGQGHPSDQYGFPSRFRFLHDRIQEAAFDCVSDDARQDFRLLIGRRLMANLGPDDEAVPQHDILSNLNCAWGRISDREERQRVARLNLVAGRKARQSLAYQDARGYLTVGRRLLGESPWQTDYEVAFELYSEAMECEYLTGNFDCSDQLFRVVVENAKTTLEKSRAYLTKIILDSTMSEDCQASPSTPRGEISKESCEKRCEQAIKIGIEAMRLFNVRYRRHPSKLHLAVVFLSSYLRLRGRKLQDLANQQMVDAEKMAALRILDALLPTTYFLDQQLIMFTALKIVDYSLRNGISPLSAQGFLFAGLGQLNAKRQYEFAQFALELAEKSNDPSIKCKVLVSFVNFFKFWREPINDSFPLLDRARKEALLAGDLRYANYSIIGPIMGQFSRGSSLNDVLRTCEEHKSFILRSKDAFATEVLTMWQNAVLALKGKTSTPYSLSDGSYDEDEAVARYRRDIGNLTLISFQYTLRLQLAYLFGRYDDALALSDQGEAVIGSVRPGGADHYFYTGMAAAAALVARNAGVDAYSMHRRRLRRCLTRMHSFAANSPDNFLQHEALLQAETARVRGRFANALKHYNRAIKLAETQDYTQLVGLANERAALCCLANEEPRLATWYLSDARAAYAKWGATAKVAWLNREYASLLAPAVSRLMADTSESGLVGSRVERFDIAAALRVSRIIASEDKDGRILTDLMQVIRIQAGAETAHLMVLDGDKLRLEATAATECGDVALFPSSDSDQESFSSAIVNYVLHTADDLMVAEADVDPRFAHCNYIKRRHPKSVLCSALRHQGKLLGVIYLEHTKMAGIFNEQKLEWLRLLTTEVGLSIWSGRLSRYREYVHKFAPTAAFTEIDSNPESPDLAAKDCDVSILFADLAGYTRMAELMEPRQLNEVVNRAFSSFLDEIHRYDGTLLEISGDELFVLFTDEDLFRHAWKAAKTALAIASAAIRINEASPDASMPLVMNMGINSGMASVGLHSVEASAGSRWRYGASGPVVNIAARIREMARNGSILISADTAVRVSDDFLQDDMGEHSLKNVMNPVHIYRLLGERSG